MMKIWFVLLAVLSSLVMFRLATHPSLAASPPAPQQYPVMDKIADKVVQKYQTSSCQQLAQEKAQQQMRPKSEEEQRAITILHNDPQMRQAFINKIAAPIANKLFECGMIP